LVPEINESNILQNIDETDFESDFMDNNEPSDNYTYTLDETTETIAKMYLKMEAKSLFPASTVQNICDDLKVITNHSHLSNKSALKNILSRFRSKLNEDDANEIINEYFSNDALYHCHNSKLNEKNVIYLGTRHYRIQYLKKFNTLNRQKLY
jgi:hypothetical protein